MLKSIIHPSTRQVFKFGRTRPKAKCPRLKLKNYLTTGLPTPPQHCNYSPKAMASLSQMYLNQQLGDCCIAGMGHLEGIFTANATGTPLILTDQQITQLYSDCGGYVPGDPSTDNGCNETDCLNWWQTKGLLADGSNKIAAWVSVDATNWQEVQTAMWLFESLYFGIELPDAYINPFPSKSGFTWSVAGDADPQNGHCFVGTSYDHTGVLISTWGMLGLFTPGAIAKYAGPSSNGELYTILSPDSIIKATQRCPNGFNGSQLQTDITSMAA